MCFFFQNLEEEVVIHRRKIETMEETGEWIIKENGGNPEVISEVHSNINRAKSTINEVTVKLNDRRRRLETALTEKQRVFDTFDDFGRRVFKLDKSLTRAKPVSPEFIIIKDQRTSHEVCLFAQFLPKNYRPYSCIWFVIVRSDSTDLHAYLRAYLLYSHPPPPIPPWASFVIHKSENRFHSNWLLTALRSLSINFVAINKNLEKKPPQLY